MSVKSDFSLGDDARAAQDMATGASMHVQSTYKARVAAEHVVNGALRNSIADAYAAYIGQVSSKFNARGYHVSSKSYFFQSLSRFHDLQAQIGPCIEQQHLLFVLVQTINQ